MRRPSTGCDVNPGGANTFVLTNPVPKIVLNRINTDPTPGNDHLSIVGAFFLPLGKSFADIDPTVQGARVVLLNRTGAVELDATIAGGIYNGSGTRGWKLTNTGRRGPSRTPRRRPPAAS